MNIAELFVSLGVKGSDQSVKAISGVNKGLEGVVSTSLEAKAAIVGALYALEQLMSTSMKTGNGLAQFSTQTGQSAEMLQRYQYAARQVGVSNEEVEGSFRSLQKSMLSHLSGEGSPSGLAMVKNLVGLDMNRLRDTAYVMQQLQAAAQKLPPDLAQKIIGSFGPSAGMIGAMQRNAFNANTMSHAPIYSDAQIGQLQKVDVAWANIGQQIKMATGFLVAKHGKELTDDISKVVTEVTKLVDVLAKFAEKAKIFEVINLAIQGWAEIFGLMNSALDKFNPKGPETEKGPHKSLKENINGWLEGKMDSFLAYKDAEKGIYAAIPPMQHKGKGTSSAPQKTETNLTVINHGVKDAQDGAHHFQRAVNKAYRQMPAPSI